jgi:hypothetical protein
MIDEVYRLVLGVVSSSREATFDVHDCSQNNK